MSTPSDTEGTRIQSVSRAARLLLHLARRRDGCTAAEAAAAVGLTVPTTYHLLNTLAAKDSRRRFALGPRIPRFALPTSPRTRPSR